jgi:GntR family transcriptional regulator / MocR family aminotransferase
VLDHFPGFLRAKMGRAAMRSPGWTELHGWHVDRGIRTPLLRQVYLQIRSAVTAGVFAPGAKLPSSRAMALRLGVARGSVVEAYRQLLAEGYVEGRPGAGTFVSAGMSELAPRSSRAARARRASLQGIPPAAKLLPEFERADAQLDNEPFSTGRIMIDARTAEIWRRLTHRAARSIDLTELGYTDPAGLLPLRRGICDYLTAARAVRCTPEQIVVTAGTQQAIDIAIRILLTPGDDVWVEDPGYPMTFAQLRLAKMRAHSVPVDAEGIVVEHGRRAAPKARAAFVTPSHQFPTGVMLSMKRRLELLAWARQGRAFIVEDDYTSEFRYSGPPLASLQGLDEDERVIYVGTLNKALFPGLRIGYAVVPRALLPAFLGARHLMDRQPPTLHQKVVADFMQEGHFAGHIRRMRQMYHAQRDVLATTLARTGAGRLEVAVPDQGMTLVAYLADGFSDVAIAAAARTAGVVVRPISPFHHAARPRNGLMLGFSGFPRQLIIPSAARLGALVAGWDLRKARSTTPAATSPGA